MGISILRLLRSDKGNSIRLPWSRLITTLLTLSLQCAIGAASTANDPLSIGSYELGQGLRVPGTDFTLGGYASTELDSLKYTPTTLRASDLSLFLWWENQGKFKFFSELDTENALNYRYGRLSGGERYLSLERLYLDYAYNPTVRFRLGKFLTPIGRWNLIHADPLVWTTSRPLVTINVFPTNVTGAMLTNTLLLSGKSIEVSLYGSSGADLRPNPAEDPFTEASGGHVIIPLYQNAQLGFSYANFEQRNERGERKNLLGSDFIWSHNRYEVSSEAIYRYSDRGPSWSEHGIFIQGVAPLTARWYAVGRYEVFHEAGTNNNLQIQIAGLSFRYRPSLVFKIEIDHTTNIDINASDGFLSSVSVLF